jgi:hypothetical protein
MPEPTATETSSKNETPMNGTTNDLPEVETEVVSDFFGQMEQFLNKLVPPDTVTVTTCAGKKVVLPGSIPARRQVRVFRSMKKMLEIDSVSLAFSGLSSSDGSAGAMINVVIDLATNEEIAELLGTIFNEAYPDACEGEHPLDVLPIEELVVGLIPFSERFVKRVGSGVLTLGKNANQLTS